MRLTALIASVLLAAAAPVLTSPVLAGPFRLIVTDTQTPLVPNSVMDLALAGGYFDRAGVEVELIRVPQTPSALAALQAGEGEMANISTEALFHLVARGGSDLRAVISPNKSLPYTILARADLTTPADLAGRSFAIGRPGSLDHSLSMKVLEAAGVDTSGLELVALGEPRQRVEAVRLGRVDATTASIGTVVALGDDPSVRVLVDADAFFQAAPLVSKVNVVTSAVLDDRRPELEAVLTALILASRDFAADPAAWVAAMAQARPDVAPADLERLAQSYAGSWSVNGGLSADELRDTAAWLLQGEDFRDVAPFGLEAWVDFGPLDAVLAREGLDPAMDPARR